MHVTAHAGDGESPRPRICAEKWDHGNRHLAILCIAGICFRDSDRERWRDRKTVTQCSAAIYNMPSSLLGVE